VESSTLSLGFARRNIHGTELDCFPMSVEQWIASGSAREPLDAIVVDPPRAGLSVEVRAWLCERQREAAGTGSLVYVSCNPVTLARDLGQLLAHGFRLDGLRLFDFSPQTSGVEAVARLR
jgi:23S rRNA (uracil1939-C5)-methyltransferase